jgi:hypothetical protein
MAFMTTFQPLRLLIKKTGAIKPAKKSRSPAEQHRTDLQVFLMSRLTSAKRLLLTETLRDKVPGTNSGTR